MFALKSYDTVTTVILEGSILPEHFNTDLKFDLNIGRKLTLILNILTVTSMI